MGSGSATRIPRWLVIASYPVGALALTAFFIFLGFPYELLSERFAGYVTSATDVRVHIGPLSPHIGLRGPGLAAVSRAPAGGDTIVIQELIVRPAWSLSWLRGDPAIHIDVTSGIGKAAGTLTLGETGGWSGSLEGVQLAHLPLEALEVVDIDGTLDATVDLHGSDDEAGGLVGQVEFELRDGTLASDALPGFALPFLRLYGTLRFGDGAFMTLEGVELEGPLVKAAIQGEISHGPTPSRRPISIQASYQVQNNPDLARKLGSIGQPGSDGRSQLLISGTLSHPVIQ